MFSTHQAFLVILASLLGGAAGKATKIPGGPLLCSTIAVAALCLGFDFPHSPPELLTQLLQLLMGCMLGQSINRRFWQDFLQIWRTTLVVIGIYTAISVPFAGVLVWMFGFSPLLAVLAATPARMQDMIVLAGSMDADAVTVMIMQLTRLFSIVVVTPFILAKYAPKANAAPARHVAATAEYAQGRTPSAWREDAYVYGALLIPGVIGGAAGLCTGHVLSILLGSFVLIAATRLISTRAGETPFPRPLGFLVQSLAGVLLGVRITPDIGNLLLARLFPVLFTTICVLGGGFFIASILHRRYGWSKALSWMAAAPGRASDMLAMSQELDITPRDRLALACMHTVRQVYFTLFVTMAITLL